MKGSDFPIYSDLAVPLSNFYTLFEVLFCYNILVDSRVVFSLTNDKLQAK